MCLFSLAMIIADVIENTNRIQTLEVCLGSLQTNPCEKTWEIRVKKCFDLKLNKEFNLYELIPTEGCPQSYCIGKNNSCTETCFATWYYSHCGLAGNPLAKELTGRGFKPRYRQTHSGSDDHLKWRFSVIGSYPKWQAKEIHGH